ncbi:MAG: AzlD domain-containing protein [Methanobacteriota archaeon]
MEREVLFVAGAGLVSVAIRLAPELWLRGRAPPTTLAKALPWLPVVIAGTMVGVLHLGAAPDDRLPYVLAAVPAGATLLWRRSFYLPLVTGAVALAALRWAGFAG